MAVPNAAGSSTYIVRLLLIIIRDFTNSIIIKGLLYFIDNGQLVE
jgi:hypothetical protein